MFIEEPVLPENNEALKEIARYADCPIATRGFKELLQQGVVDIIQPDLSHAGGILETGEIAAMARSTTLPWRRSARSHQRHVCSFNEFDRSRPRH